MSNSEFDRGRHWGFFMGMMCVVLYFGYAHKVEQWIFGPPPVPAAYRSWDVDDSMYQVNLPLVNEEQQLANVSLTQGHVADCENYFVFYGEVRFDCQDWKEYLDYCGHWRTADQAFAKEIGDNLEKTEIDKSAI